MRTEAEPTQRSKEGFFRRHKEAALYGALYVAPAALFWLASEGAESMLEMDGVDVALLGTGALCMGTLMGGLTAFAISEDKQALGYTLKGLGTTMAGVATGIVLAGATDII